MFLQECGDVHASKVGVIKKGISNAAKGNSGWLPEYIGSIRESYVFNEEVYTSVIKPGLDNAFTRFHVWGRRTQRMGQQCD